MIRSIPINNYVGQSTYRAYPFMDETGKVLEYFVDYMEDYENETGPYREYIRFKFNGKTLEVYEGEMYGGLGWSVNSIMTVLSHVEVTEENAIKMAKDWINERTFKNEC